MVWNRQLAHASFLSVPLTCCCSYNWSGGRIVGFVIAAVCFSIACVILIYSCCLVRRRRRAYAAWHVSWTSMCCALRATVSLSDFCADGGLSRAGRPHSASLGVLHLGAQAMLHREARGLPAVSHIIRTAQPRKLAEPSSLLQANQVQHQHQQPGYPTQQGYQQGYPAQNSYMPSGYQPRGEQYAGQNQ